MSGVLATASQTARGPFAADNPWGIAFWCVLGLYAATLPIEGTVALRNLCLVLLTGFFAVALWRRQVRLVIPLPLAWGLYAAVAAASLTYAIDPAYSLSEIRVEVVYPLIVFVIGSNCLRSERALQHLLWILAATNLCMVGYSLYVAATGGSTKDGLIGTWNTGVGTFSTYIVMVAPLLAYLGWRQWRSGHRSMALAIAVLLAANIVDMHVTQNRQSYVALIVELAIAAGWIVIHHFSWRRLAWIGAVTACLAALLVSVQITRFAGQPHADAVDVVKTDARIELWRFSIARIGEHPWSGGGFGLRVFQKQFDHLGDDKMLWHAHNMVINKGIQMGIPGMLAFLVLYFAVPWRMREGLGGDEPLRALALAGIAMAAGVFVKNMTDDFFTRDMAQFFWLLAGAVVASTSSAARARN